MSRSKRSGGGKKTTPRGARPAKTRPRRTPVPVGFLLVLLVAAGFVWHAHEWQFTQDDAYISLRYAKNLVEGHGLVFNPGERVEGYSNFTWTLLLALFLKLGAPAVEASRWLGIVFGTLAVLSAARLARALEGRWGAASVGTAVLVAGNPAFALWSTGGLETALYAFLVTAGLERGLAPGVGPRGRLLGPALLCLAALSRPDGPLVFGLWFLVRAFDTLRGSGPAVAAGGARGLGQDLVVFVGPLVPYALWKLAYYGDLLPNTYYAKAGISAVYLTRGLDYAMDWFRSYGVLGVAPVLALLSLAREHSRGVEARLLFVWLGVAAYIVAIGGDVLYLHRFWLPILPIGAVLVARGATVLAERALRPQPRAAAAAAVVLMLVLTGIGIRGNLEVTRDRRRTETLFVSKMLGTGQWLKRQMEPGSSIAVTTIGAIAYESDLVVIDMLGLTDREVARHPQMFEGLEDTWREIKYNARSVLEREPDGIIFSTDVRPSSAAERALYLYEVFHESYFAFYYRSFPGRLQMQTILLRRNDAPPFRPDRVDAEGFAFIEDYIQAHIQKGRHNDNRAALELFDRALVDGPSNFPGGREWRAVAMGDMGDERAEAALKEVVAADPYATVALGRLGMLLLSDNRPDEAEPYLQRLTELNPGDNTGWAGLAEIYRRRGDYSQAFVHMKRAVTEWTTSDAQLLTLANIATHMRDLALARRCLEGALRLSGNGPLAEGARQGLRALDAVESGQISLEQVLESSR